MPGDRVDAGPRDRSRDRTDACRERASSIGAEVPPSASHLLPAEMEPQAREQVDALWDRQLNDGRRPDLV